MRYTIPGAVSTGCHHNGRRFALFPEGDEKPSVDIEICPGRNQKTRVIAYDYI